jgi:hypothetical protein
MNCHIIIAADMAAYVEYDMDILAHLLIAQQQRWAILFSMFLAHFQSIFCPFTFYFSPFLIHLSPLL